MAWPHSLNVPTERMVTASPALQEKAVDIHSARRERSEFGPPLEQSFCEAALPLVYGQEFKPSYLRKYPKSIQVIMMDQMGRTLRVVSSGFWPKRVQEHRLDVDLVVFASKLRLDVAFYGWLTVEEIKEAPVGVLSRDGEESEFFEIEREVMNEMPLSWDFDVPCSHEWNSIWNDGLRAAECCKCGHAFNTSTLRKRWESVG